MTWNCYLYSFTIQDQFWTFKIYPPYHIIAASVGDIIPPQSEEELTFRDPRTILEIEHLDRPKEHFDNFI